MTADAGTSPTGGADAGEARCPICDGASVSFAAGHRDFEDARIFRCSGCSHWFTNPEPDDQALETYYKTLYSEQRRRHFGESYFVLMERRAEAQLDYIRRHLDQGRRRSAPGRWGRVLDLGCGVGALVARLQSEGADAIGYDSDPAAIEVGKNRWKANVHLAALNDTSASHGQFDLLCMSHVVEHLPKVRQALTEILRLLGPGGFVFLEVPNCFAEMFSRNVSTEAHINFFTRGSLCLLLEQVGLQVASCVTCGPRRRLALEDGARRTGVASRVFSRLRATLGAAVAAVSYRRKGAGAHVRTIYDGTYARYYGDDQGLWVRCVARKV